MSEQKHFLTLTIEDDGQLIPWFVCTGKRGDACHKQPADDREEWGIDDPDLIDTDECWVAEWVDAVGFDEAIRWENPGEILRLPITSVGWDQGPVCEVQNQTTHDREVATVALGEYDEWWRDYRQTQRVSIHKLSHLAAQKRGA